MFQKKSHLGFLVILSGLLFVAALISWPQASKASRVTDSPNESPNSFVRESAKLSLILKDLVQSHPSREVREDMDQAIRSGTLPIAYQEMSGAEAYDAFLAPVQTDRGIRLVLFTPKSFLEDSTTSRTYKQLVLYHEWIHALQHLQGHLLPNGIRSPVSQHVENEVEAYAAECELAKQLNASGEEKLCQSYNQKGKQGLRDILLEQLKH